MVIKQKEEFANEFIDRYFQRGFGSMNKNDFEVLIFDLLKRFGDLKGKSAHSVSLTLQIPESKVKRLAYEADLKYANRDERYVKEEFFKLILKANFKAENQKIFFEIEDKFIRNAINSKLKDLGHFADSSFNRDLVSVHIDAFVDLLNEYYPREATTRIIGECKDVLGKDADEITFKGILKKFIDGAATKTGGIVVSSAFAAISGGATTGVELVDAIKKMFSK